MLIAVLLSCLAIAWAAPQGKPNEPIAIISQSSDVGLEGYQWSYETANGIKAQESGSLKKPSDPKGEEAIAAQGSFSYTAPDGTPISVTYVANDEQGFVPQGDHLPTAPPIPPAILKALEYIKSLPPSPAGRA